MKKKPQPKRKAPRRKLEPDILESDVFKIDDPANLDRDGLLTRADRCLRVALQIIDASYAKAAEDLAVQLMALDSRTLDTIEHSGSLIESATA